MNRKITRAGLSVLLASQLMGAGCPSEEALQQEREAILAKCSARPENLPPIRSTTLRGYSEIAREIVVYEDGQVWHWLYYSKGDVTIKCWHRAK